MRTLPNYLAYTLWITSALVGLAGGYASVKIQTPDYVAKSEELLFRLDKLVGDAEEFRNSAEHLERSTKKLRSTTNSELRKILEEMPEIDL